MKLTILARILSKYGVRSNRAQGSSEWMAQDFSALYNLLDRQIKQGESERALTDLCVRWKGNMESSKHLSRGGTPILKWGGARRIF